MTQVRYIDGRPVMTTDLKTRSRWRFVSCPIDLELDNLWVVARMLAWTLLEDLK